MEQVGKVVKAYDGVVEVIVVRDTSCGGECGKCSGCPVTGVRITTKNSIHAQVGDKVKLYSDSKQVLFGAMIVYLLPIVFMILGYLIGIYIFHSFKNTETMSIFLGMLSTATAFIVVRKIDTNIFKKHFKINIGKF